MISPSMVFAERAEQEAELGVQVEVVGRDDQLAARRPSG